MLLEKTDVGLAAQEPEVLDDDILPGYFLRREEGKAHPQIDLEVLVERRDRVDARAIGLARTLREDRADQVKVLLHASRFGFAGPRRQLVTREPALRESLSPPVQARIASMHVSATCR